MQEFGDNEAQQCKSLVIMRLLLYMQGCGWSCERSRVNSRDVELRFRGGLVFKAHRLLYHSTLGLIVIHKKKCGSGGVRTGGVIAGLTKLARAFFAPKLTDLYREPSIST